MRTRPSRREPTREDVVHANPSEPGNTEGYEDTGRAPECRLREPERLDERLHASAPRSQEPEGRANVRLLLLREVAHWSTIVATGAPNVGSIPSSYMPWTRQVTL
jgi:hypothetical protein